MKRVAGIKIIPLVLLALLPLLALRVHRRGLTTQEVTTAVVTAEDTVERDKYVTVAVLGLIALFGFVVWAALRPNEGEEKAMQPKESSASDNSTIR